jgi:predicted ester cyclase
MTEQEELNKAIVLRFNREVMQNGNIEAVHEIISPDFINHTAPPGTARGPQGIIDFTINMMHKALTDVSVQIHDQVIENDKVVTRKTIYGTQVGTFMGVAPSGEQVAINIIDIITLKNGQYTEHWSIRDIQDMIDKSAKANNR